MGFGTSSLLFYHFYVPVRLDEISLAIHGGVLLATLVGFLEVIHGGVLLATLVGFLEVIPGGVLLAILDGFFEVIHDEFCVAIWIFVLAIHVFCRDLPTFVDYLFVFLVIASDVYNLDFLDRYYVFGRAILYVAGLDFF